MISKEEILAAIDKAAIGHRHKSEVRKMMVNREKYAKRILSDITDGSYAEKNPLQKHGENKSQRETPRHPLTFAIHAGAPDNMDGKDTTYV